MNANWNLEILLRSIIFIEVLQQFHETTKKSWVKTNSAALILVTGYEHYRHFKFEQRCASEAHQLLAISNICPLLLGRNRAVELDCQIPGSFQPDRMVQWSVERLLGRKTERRRLYVE